MRRDTLLEALYSSATEAIIVTNIKGEIILANPRSHELFRYEEGELVGKLIEILVPVRYREHHVKDRESFYHAPHKRLMGMGRDLFALRKDGTEFPVEISLSYFEEEGELFTISFIIDITRRKTDETALIQAKTELERSNNELEQFAYVASHDLQEPLRKIQAFGDRLRSKEWDKLGPDSQDYLSRMLNAAERMKILINDLLTFSRVTTQAKPYQQVDLNKILREVLSDLEIAIERANAILEADELPVIDADPLQMRQLFQNLIGNALKFRKEGVQAHIRVRCEYPTEKRDVINIRIEDNGIGFDTKYLDRIFNIFQRLEGRNFEGSGVGLAICRKIALRHNGSITAQSEPGQGSVFIVKLPVKQKIRY